MRTGHKGNTLAGASRSFYIHNKSNADSSVFGTNNENLEGANTNIFTKSTVPLNKFNKKKSSRVMLKSLASNSAV